MYQEIDQLTKESYEPQIVADVGQYANLRPMKNYYKGDCPICGHQDLSHPCFAVKVLRGFVFIKCFHEGCRFTGNIYSFIRAVKGCTTLEAINDFRDYLCLPPVQGEISEERVTLSVKLVSALSGNGKLKPNRLIKRKMARIYKRLYQKDRRESFVAALAFNRERCHREAWSLCYTRCYERLQEKTWKNEQEFLYEVISELNQNLSALPPLKSEAGKKLNDRAKSNGNMDAMSFSEYELAMTCPTAHLSKDKEGRRRVAYSGEPVPVCYVKDEISDLEILPDPSANPEDSILAVSELENFENRYGEPLLRFRAGLLTVEKTCRNLGISKATLYRIIKKRTQHN
jgi:hypothetical protein